jgi:hypothetical protein
MSDTFLSEDEIQQVLEARAGAQKLLDELLQRQKEIEANPPDISAKQLAEGRAAFQKAIDAARRTLTSLEEAMRVAGIQLN